MNYDINQMLKSQIKNKISPKITKHKRIAIKIGILYGLAGMGTLCILLAVLFLK